MCFALTRCGDVYGKTDKDLNAALRKRKGFSTCPISAPMLESGQTLEIQSWNKNSADMVESINPNEEKSKRRRERWAYIVGLFALVFCGVQYGIGRTITFQQMEVLLSV